MNGELDRILKASVMT